MGQGGLTFDTWRKKALHFHYDNPITRIVNLRQCPFYLCTEDISAKGVFPALDDDVPVDLGQQRILEQRRSPYDTALPAGC